MPIKKWREVEYTDDGCSLYQCLNCYNTWESRTPPSSYCPQYAWKFCPYCGCEWEEEQKQGYNKWTRFLLDNNIQYPYVQQDYYFTMEERMWLEGETYYSCTEWTDRDLPYMFSGKFLTAKQAAQHLKKCKQLHKEQGYEIVDRPLGFISKTDFFIYQYRIVLRKLKK